MDEEATLDEGTDNIQTPQQGVTSNNTSTSTAERKVVTNRSKKTTKRQTQRHNRPENHRSNLRRRPAIRVAGETAHAAATDVLRTVATAYGLHIPAAANTADGVGINVSVDEGALNSGAGVTATVEIRVRIAATNPDQATTRIVHIESDH